MRELWPDFRDQLGPVTATVTARFAPQGAEQTMVGAPMAPGDAKADVLISGRLFRVSFAGRSAPTNCRIGTPVFDVSTTGLL